MFSVIGVVSHPVDGLVNRESQSLDITGVSVDVPVDDKDQDGQDADENGRQFHIFSKGVLLRLLL